MVKILIGIILGYIIHHHIRRLFLKWQLRELERMAGILSSEEGFYGTPGKWGKRFKYLHNFVVETRGQLLQRPVMINPTITCCPDTCFVSLKVYINPPGPDKFGGTRGMHPSQKRFSVACHRQMIVGLAYPEVVFTAPPFKPGY